MSLLYISILLLLCAWLGLRLRRVNHVIRQVTEGAKQGQPVLRERQNGKLLDELTLSVNSLVEEKASISHAGKGYLNQIEATLVNLREAVVMVDEDNIIRLSNPVFREMASPATDPLGKRLDIFIHGDAFHQFLNDVRKTEGGRREEICVEMNSRERWLDVSAASLPESTPDNEDYSLFVFHDITRQKNLEKMRTEFVANVSHELKTPVTIIKGFIDTLVEDDAILSSEERTRFLKKIQSNSERLHTLLEDLLLLSRLESTDVILQRETLEVAEFMEDFASNWESVLENEGRRLSFSLDPDLKRIYADPLRLNQLLTNLVHNAIRHAKDFTEIRIETTREGESVRITVSDNGSGIPEADLPHIFQRFYRVEKGRSREAGGTGLGLSIVKHIVAQHGGEVRARSRTGEGTSIDVILPQPT